MLCVSPSPTYGEVRSGSILETGKVVQYHNRLIANRVTIVA